MKKLGYSALILSFIALAALALAYTAPARTLETLEMSTTTSPEITRIKELKGTAAQAVELKKLLERVGPVEAQEEMFRSGLPFTGETHLLVHVVGEYVYDHYGPKGVAYCRDYFLSACYHAVIIDTLADFGLDGVAEAMKNCLAAPPGVVAQCAHGAGHGFVAWHDYDLLKGVKMCDQLGEKVPNFAYFNCYDGAFMENVWGVHGGKPSEKRWVKDDDLYYPCNDPRIPSKYLGGCWSNQATLIYQHYHGDLKKTAEACDKVENKSYRDICYNNFARQIHPLTAGDKAKVTELCRNATGLARQEECELTNMTAFWSVGDRLVPFTMCNEAIGDLQRRCFDRLIGLINYYATNSQEKAAYCDNITDKTYQEKCRK